MKSGVQVAVLGLGRMGSGIAERIASAFEKTRVFDLSPEKTEALADVAIPCNSAAAAVRDADIVVLSLFDDNSIFAALDGEEGILRSLPPGSVVVNATTISSNAAREAEILSRKSNVNFLHAPVLGRPDAAASGHLLSYAAGDRQAFEKAAPVLKAYTAKFHHVGEDVATAARTKLLINYVAASLIDLMGQVYAFGEKALIDRSIIENTFEQLMPNQPFPMYSGRVGCGDFDDTGFSLRLGLKDINLMLRMSSEVEAPLPNAAQIHDRMIGAIAHGYSESDWSSWTIMSRIAAGLDQTPT